MGQLVKALKNYKNAVYVFLACVVITCSGFVFPKGQYYHYNYERQILKDCAMGWYQPNDMHCNNAKERQRLIDDEELNNNNQMSIPQKANFDYVMFLGSILQVVFICIATFTLGVSTKGKIESIKKEEKTMQTLKYIGHWLQILVVIIAFLTVTNYVFVIVNGIFTSNDFLRFLFEVSISLITLMLGRKL